MKDVLVMSDLDQIKAISQPYRIQILEAFDDAPSTAKQISERLGEPHAKVNYHIKALLQQGILTLVEEVVRMGIIEKYYVPVAKRFVVQSTSMKFNDEEVMASINQYRLMIFDATSEAFYKAIEKRDITTQIKLNMLHDIYLTEEDVVKLNTEISEVLNKYSELHPHKAPDTKKYVVTSIIVPDSTTK